MFIYILIFKSQRPCQHCSTMHVQVYLQIVSLKNKHCVVLNSDICWQPEASQAPVRDHTNLVDFNSGTFCLQEDN